MALSKPSRVCSREDNIFGIDKTIKNKFKWSWLEEVDCNKDYLSDYIRKLDSPGVALCIWCNDTLKYGRSGKRDLLGHASRNKHKKARPCGQSLPALFQQTSEVVGGGNSNKDGNSKCTLPYGTAPNIPKNAANGSMHTLTNNSHVKPGVSFLDRKAHAEARTISFLAEHSLPFSMVPHLVDYAKEMSTDLKVLNTFSMERTTASYKLREGLHTVTHKRLVNDLRKYKFSINMDECTASNNEKIFSILVCYYSDEERQSVTRHYCSLSLITVNAEVIHKRIIENLEKDEIPLDNLISSLSDSANYMRGKISGVETRLRSSAPHLLDIDGDVCHHVHNSVKIFCQPFSQHLEKLADDLFTDFKYSPDLKEHLKTICLCLGINYRTPPQRVAHRWLSVYDVIVTDLSMWDALTLFYYPWVPKEESVAFKGRIEEILKPLSEESRKAIRDIHAELKKKNLTEDGRKRKYRIQNKLFCEYHKTSLQSNLYTTVLPLFKSFILMFEQKEPLCHRLHDEQTELVKNFLSCFIRHEHLRDVSAKKLLQIDVTDKALHLPNFFIGSKAEKLIKAMHKDDIRTKTFLSSVKEAYVKSGQYILKKFNLNNALLKCLSAIDPKAQGHGVTFSLLDKLMKYFPTVLVPDEEDIYKSEISRIQLDSSLPSCSNGEKDKRLDFWWTEVMECGKYPVLCRVIKACLSIFTGPKIEQSFSVMNDIITAKSNRLHTDTYSAIQSVKYDLKARETTSLALYHRDDILTDPVDKSMVYHMQTAYNRYKKNLDAKAKIVQNKKQKLKLQNLKQKSPQKAKNVHTIAKRIKKRIHKTNRSKSATIHETQNSNQVPERAAVQGNSVSQSPGQTSSNQQEHVMSVAYNRLSVAEKAKAKAVSQKKTHKQVKSHNLSTSVNKSPSFRKRQTSYIARESPIHKKLAKLTKAPQSSLLNFFQDLHHPELTSQ